MANYGELTDQIQKNMSEALVEAATGMSIADYAQATTTTTTADFTTPSIQDQMVLDMQRKMQDMQRQRQIDMAQLNIPFDETDDFRDYVVWLCGYTQRKTPPSQEEWEDLREETKKVAAKFALRTRTKRTQAHSGPEVYDTAAYGGTSAGRGVSGSQTLIGNEETFTTYTGANTNGQSAKR